MKVPIKERQRRISEGLRLHWLERKKMKITETIERECCLSKDLKPYKGDMSVEVKPFSPHFCIHCGQIWVEDTEMGPAGSSEPVSKKVKITTSNWRT